MRIHCLRVLRLSMWLGVTGFFFLTIGEPHYALAAQSGGFAKFAHISMPFVENSGGERDNNTRFSARTFFGAVHVGETGDIFYALPFQYEQEGQKQCLVFKESLAGKRNSVVVGEDRSTVPVHIFSGKHLQSGAVGPAVFESVSLGEVYEGIQVSLKATANSVEKIFRLKPGADWRQIQLKVSGGQGIRLGEAGELLVATEVGPVAFSAPVAFQEMEDGRRRFVEVSYNLIHTQEAVYGFTVGEYDPFRELVIDPILASTFFGQTEVPNPERPFTGLGVDGENNVFVVGITSAADFPVTTGSFDGSYNGGQNDIFVVKLDKNLQKLLAVTFIGGEGNEFCKALLVDRHGFVYLAGSTTSSSFPVTPRAFQAKLSGLQKNFILKLDNSLSHLEASSLFADGMAFAMTADRNDEIYVGGATTRGLPEESARNPEIFEIKYRGGETDGFVAKFDGNLEHLIAMTLLGGKGWDVIMALTTTDKADAVYATGFTDSPDFPVSSGAYDTAYNSAEDVFVAKLDGRLSKLLAATFLGGKGMERAFAVARDASGFLYVTGKTGSQDFPVFEKSFDSTYNGGESDVFVAKFDANLASLVVSSFLGGVGDDHAFSLLLDPEQRSIILVGDTDSKGFDGIGGTSSLEKGTSSHAYSLVMSMDFYLPKMSFLGGSGQEICPVAVRGADGSIFIAGSTSSRDFPVSPEGYKTAAREGVFQAFVAKIDAILENNHPK